MDSQPEGTPVDTLVVNDTPMDGTGPVEPPPIESASLVSPPIPAATERPDMPIDKSDAVRARLEKLDDVEFNRRVTTTKSHPLLPKFVEEVIGIDDFVFGEDDEFEDLVSFETWLLDTTHPIPLGDTPPAPPATATAAPPHEPPQTVETSRPDPAASLATAYVVPRGNKAAEKPKAGGGEEPIKFAPVTSAGMAAFFAAIRRNNTQMSFATDATEADASQHTAPMEVEASPTVTASGATAATATTPSPAVSNVEIVAPIPPSTAEVAPPTAAPTARPMDVDLTATAPAATTPEPPMASPASVPGANVPAPAPTREVTPADTAAPAALETRAHAVPEHASSGTVPPPTPPIALADTLRSVVREVMDGGSEPPRVDEGDKKRNRAQYMRYYRSLRSPNCPAIIRKQFEEANAASPAEYQQKLQALFQVFKDSNEDWMNSSIVLRETRSHSTSHHGIWKWMTRDDT